MTPTLDLYCERTDPSLWSEPLNAVTNLAFVAAGVFAWRAYRRAALRPARTADLVLLVALLFAIGIGSTVWHLVPTPATKLGDQIPILLFINVYLAVFLVRVEGMRWAGTLAAFAAYHAANVAIGRAFPPDFLNGSVFYLPTWIAMLVLAANLIRKGDHAAPAFARGVALFTAAVVFRTVDHAACPSLPTGTHFLWHLLDGAALYRVMAVVIQRCSAMR